MTRKVDWTGLMRLGLGALRLSPEVFWQMTPVELQRALEGAGILPLEGQMLLRKDLDRLMQDHPDAPRNAVDRPASKETIDATR